MKFGDPELLGYIIWAVPLLLVFYVWVSRSERKTMEKFAQADLIGDIAPHYDRKRRWLVRIMDVMVLFFMVAALARPQWGFYWRDDKSEGIDILLAVDVSKSMLAVDVAPNRLEFIKTELANFVRKLKEDRVGLIAFAGEAFLQCPLTVDQSGFLLAMNSIDTDTIPVGGTVLSSTIKEAIRSYKGAEARDRLMFIITDGENTKGDLQKAVNKAKKEEITISCIGIGSKDGEFIPVLDEKGNRSLLRDESGNPVKSRLMEETLKMIARETGGRYVKAEQTGLGIDGLYDMHVVGREKKAGEKEEKIKVYKERFQLPLAAAVMMLLMEIVLRDRRRHAGKK